MSPASKELTPSRLLNDEVMPLIETKEINDAETEFIHNKLNSLNKELK